MWASVGWVGVWVWVNRSKQAWHTDQTTNSTAPATFGLTQLSGTRHETVCVGLTKV